MRILFHLRGSLLESRGTPSRARNQLLAVQGLPAGHAVAAVSRDQPGEVARRLGVEQFASPSPAAMLETLRAAVADFRPDLVVGHTHKGAFDVARLAPASARLVADLHGDLAWEKLEDLDRGMGRWVRGYLSTRLHERRTFGALDGFVTVGHALADRVSRRWHRPVKVLVGAVDPDRFRAPTPPPGDGILVGYAGSFRSYQGIDDLIYAVARLRARREAVRLLLVGDVDTVGGRPRRVMESLGEAVELLGRQPYERMPELLGRCDVLVVPRRRGRSALYNYPSKLSEFLALGRAVVVTDVGEASRVVEDGRSGLVVPAGRPAAMAAALERLLDPALRMRLAGGARELAVERLTWQRHAEQLIAFARSLE